MKRHAHVGCASVRQGQERTWNARWRTELGALGAEATLHVRSATGKAESANNLTHEFSLNIKAFRWTKQGERMTGP